jgi:hypothetical protein
MMLSVLVWLAMWGQGQTPNCELLKSGHVLCSDFRLVKPPKPAEHVIEIKTVRKLNGKTQVCYYITTGEGSPCETITKPKYCPQAARCQDL